MASTDARPIPFKNAAYRVYLAIFDADGDLVSGATGLDSEVSLDGGAFADCTNEATEIGSSGIYYLDLVQAEMNADAVVVIVKTSSSGAKTTPIVMYPEEAGDVRVNVTQFGGTALTAAAGIPEVKVASIANNAITAASIATDAIDADAIADNAVNAGAIASDAITAAKLAADVATELQSGLATSAALGSMQTDIDLIDTKIDTIDNFIDTEIATLTTNVGLIKAKTDLLTALIPHSGTLGATGNDTTHLHLEGLTYGDDGLNDAMVVLYDDSAGLFYFRSIDDWVAATDLATVATLPVTPEASTDQYWIIPSVNAGTIPTVQQIVDGVLDEALAGHVDAGSVGEAIDAAGTAGDPWTTALPGAYGSGTAGKIIGDNLNAPVGDVPTNAELATALGTADDAVLAAIATLQTYVDTEVAAIKAKTDNLPTDPADASDIAAAIATLQGYVDTEVAAILAAVDTEVAAIKAKTDNLPTDPADESSIQASIADLKTYVDTEVAAIKAKTDQLTFGVTNRLSVNTTHIVGVEMAGTGVDGDEFIPA